MARESINTLIAEALAGFEDPSGAVVPSIQPSTTFERDANYELVGEFIYRRNSSPTVRDAERALATIEGGADALVFSSGMAAFAGFMGALPRGARVVAPRVMYHGAQDWLHRLAERSDITLRLFDEISAEGLAEAMEDGVDVAWIETPVNPTWDVIDIEEAARIVHANGAVLAVDSTVAPPVTTRALHYGADIVFHSATKYLNGHSDVTAGVLVTAHADDLWGDVQSVRVSHGSVASPFDVWLLLRGLRTLGVRYERASASALAVATALETNPWVERVLYPGLASHHQYPIAARQMTGGFGGMLSVLVAGDSVQARSVATGTSIFTTATSLGGTESLIEHRATVEGPNSVVPGNLLRISVGLEDEADLISDLERSLSSTFTTTKET